MITIIDVDLIKDYLENYPVRDVTCDGSHLKTLTIDGERLWHIHTSSDWIIDIEPTTATEGSQHKECTDCGEISETATIPALEPLKFTLSENGTYYSVAATDIYVSGVIAIPSTYGEEDLPVAAIANNAFDGCSKVVSIVIPDSVTTIGDYAFRGCYSLTSIVIPDSVTSIGSNAFRSCYSLTSVVIPNGVASIQTGVFAECHSLTSVVIPDSVKTIGSVAFMGCSSLTSVVIPSVKTIGEHAFRKCSSLTSITFGTNYLFNTIERGVFEGCSSLANIELPWTIFHVESEAFKDCTSLTRIALINVESIGDYAFRNCSNLFSIMFSSKAQQIGKDILLGCDSFDRIYYDGEVDTNIYYPWDEFVEDAEIDKPNDVLLNATRLDFSQDEPDEEGKHWHWVDGVPTVWCNHNAVLVAGKEPTCTEDGITAGSYCSKCGEILVAQQVIEAPGHKYSSIITPPTCMTAGRIDYICNCGDVSGFDIIPKTDHRLGKWYWSESNGEWRRDCQYEGCDHHIVSNGYEHLFEFIMLSNGTYAIRAADDMVMPQVLEIPSTYNDVPITRIADGGFKENIYLNEVIIPEGIEEIGSSAFFDCSMLGYDLVIPSSVSLIESNAFGQCGGIRTITFAKSDGYSANTHIEEGAFSDCHGLEELTIPSTVTHIENGAFERCYGLEFLRVEEGNPRYHSENNCIIETDTNIVILGCKNSIIPNIVYKIGSGAFGVIHQAPIKIPLSVTVIESLAFAECENLILYVEAPSKPEGWADDWCDDSVTVVWDYTEGSASCYHIFEEWIRGAPTCTMYGVTENRCSICGRVEAMILPALGHDWSDWIIDVEPTTATEGSRHRVCANFGEVETEPIPKLEPLTYTLSEDKTYYSVKATDTYVTGDITILDEYKGLPVTTIGWQAFSDCDSLTSVVIPDSVTTISGLAFQNCSNIDSVVMGNGVTSIGNNAFWNCSSLTSIVIPDSVTFIGDGAFSSCSSLTSVCINNLVSWCSIAFSSYLSNPLYYAHNLYVNGEIVTELVIPDSVTTIGNYAFRECLSLVSVVIPDSVTSIGDSAFAGCSSLVSVVIGDSVTSISYGAFLGCYSLVSVDIPDGVTSIGSSAFSGCYSLVSVVIPDSVTSIGNYAFYYCNELVVYYYGTKVEWSKISIVSPNEHLINATRYYYIRLHPLTEGNFWRWVDDVPTAWCNDIVIDEAVEPTCTTTGLTEGSHCSVCGTVFVAQIVLPELGHDWGAWEIVTEPTCTTIGTSRKHCPVCDGYDIMIREALGHNYKSVVIPPTCIEQGYTSTTCTRCNDSYKDNYIDALGHTPSDWIIDIEPTHLAAGSKHRECTVCGERLETELIPKLETYLVTEDGAYLTDEQGRLLII